MQLLDSWFEVLDQGLLQAVHWCRAHFEYFCTEGHRLCNKLCGQETYLYVSCGNGHLSCQISYLRAW
jgi:hypothetical protein